MARDLSFWKVKEEQKEKNSQVYALLCEEVYLEYIEELPMEQILQDFKKEFDDWEVDGDTNFSKEAAAFDLFLTKQLVRVDCYSVAEEDMNRIMDIMFQYNCPLYDSAIDVRFE